MKFIMLSDQSLGLVGKAENQIVGNKRAKGASSYGGQRPVGNKMGYWEDCGELSH